MDQGLLISEEGGRLPSDAPLVAVEAAGPGPAEEPDDPWRTELVLKDSRMKLTVRWRTRLLVQADLPYVGVEGLALRHLLEGLALWQGPPLYVVCDVDGLAARGESGRAVPRLLVPQSPLKALVDTLGGIAALCRRACGRLSHGLPVPKNRREERALRGAWAGARAAIAALCAHLDDDEQEDRNDAGSRDEDCDPQTPGRGPRSAGHCECAEDLPRSSVEGP